MTGFSYPVWLRPTVFLGVVVLGVAGKAPAQTIDMLEIEPDSRSTGMGYAGVALSGNANSTFWNPAALVGDEGAEVSLNRFEFAPGWYDIMLNDVAVRYHRWKSSAIGAGMRYVHWGQPECRAETPNCMNERWDLALGVSYSVRLSPTVSVGTSMKYIYLRRWAGDYQRDLPDSTPGEGFGVDVGGRFKSGSTDFLGRKSIISVGVNLANVGPEIRYGRPEFKAELPTYLRFGWSVVTRLDGVRSIALVNDFKLPLVHRHPDLPNRPGLFDRAAVGIGVEYVPDDLVTLRMGFQAGEYLYNRTDRQVVTIGAGLRYEIVRLDAAYATGVWTEQRTAGKVRFTLGVGFGAQGLRVPGNQFGGARVFTAHCTTAAKERRAQVSSTHRSRDERKAHARLGCSIRPLPGFLLGRWTFIRHESLAEATRGSHVNDRFDPCKRTGALLRGPRGRTTTRPGNGDRI